MSDQSTQAAGTTQNTGSAQPDAGTTTTASAPAAAPAAAAASPAAAPASQSQQATAGQTTGDQPGGSTKAADTTSAPAGAPDKYEFKAPTGSSLDADVVAEFSAVAKELNLSQDAAQKVIDKLVPKVADGNAKAMVSAMKSTVDGWAKASAADTEFGGEKLQENLAVAAKAVERYASPELRALLGAYDPQKNPKGTGLGNHPDVVRLFVRIGKAISEDKHVTGTTDPGKGAKSAAESLYGPNKA